MIWALYRSLGYYLVPCATIFYLVKHLMLKGAHNKCLGIIVNILSVFLSGSMK